MKQAATPSAARGSQPLVSRFTILLLAAVLLCLDWGRSLPAELTEFFGFVGLAGIAMYACLEFVAHYRARQYAHTLRTAAEARLTKQSDPVSGAETEVWDCPAQHILQTTESSRSSSRSSGVA